MENTFIFGERGEDSGVRFSPLPSDPSSTTELHHPASLSPSPVSFQSPQKMGGRLRLDSASLPWQGAPGPRDRKPAGQAQ